MAGIGPLRAGIYKPFVPQNEAADEYLQYFDEDPSIIDLLRSAYEVHAIPLGFTESDSRSPICTEAS